MSAAMTEDEWRAYERSCADGYLEKIQRAKKAELLWEMAVEILSFENEDIRLEVERAWRLRGKVLAGYSRDRINAAVERFSKGPNLDSEDKQILELRLAEMPTLEQAAAECRLLARRVVEGSLSVQPLDALGRIREELDIALKKMTGKQAED